jgi:acetyltransferase-like isoleucine patch superfamily enzyme
MLERISNGKLIGLASVPFFASTIILHRTRDFISNLFFHMAVGQTGRGVRFCRNTVIRYPGNIKIGNNTVIADGVSITSELDSGRCDIGENCIIGRNVHLDFSGGLKIADGVTISESVKVFTHSHGIDPRSPAKPSPLTIGSNVWIGAHALILENTGTVGDSSIIAAGAVVTKPVCPAVLAAGVPARTIKNINVV